MGCRYFDHRCVARAIRRGDRDGANRVRRLRGHRGGTTDAKFELQAKPGTNTVVASFTFGPNSSTGWHTHPGRTLVTVKSGTFTVYHADDCAPLVYEPGDAFVELPSMVHVGRNETTETVELGVVFFKVPIGGSPRIDQAQPEDCEVT